jgi:hypothetical protein
VYTKNQCGKKVKPSVTKDSWCPEIRRLTIAKVAMVPKPISRFNATPGKIPSAFFIGMQNKF